MTSAGTIFQALKPGIPKRYLLFVAALVWTFAGGMLFFRGFPVLVDYPHLLWLKIVISIIFGLIFYAVLFDRISSKHTQRILKMEIGRPCLFSFFNFKSYLMMALMITMGVTLRKTGIVPLQYLSAFYVTMGVPLSLSAIRFYYNGIFYKRATTHNS
jgi:hypothetical protein